LKLSTRTRHGTRAMIEIARNFNKAPVKRKEIVRHQHLSQDYLENILLVLKKRQLIRTERGASGGYVLNKTPSMITLYDIMDALEGSLAPVECVENPADCKQSGKCVARKAWARLHEAQVGVLKGISLQDLLDMENESDGTLMYFI
jgi:Rrf2 family transcriptional regulator, cysteine metabolism repressor